MIFHIVAIIYPAVVATSSLPAIPATDSEAPTSSWSSFEIADSTAASSTSIVRTGEYSTVMRHFGVKRLLRTLPNNFQKFSY